MTEFEEKATATLAAVRDLSDYLIKNSSDGWSSLDDVGETEPVIALLMELLKQRVHAVHCFELLSLLDLEQAKRWLIENFLGHRAQPDHRYGGHHRVLSLTLWALWERGEDHLIDVLTRPEFDERKLSDPRFREALAWAFDEDVNEGEALQAWLEEHVLNAAPMLSEEDTQGLTKSMVEGLMAARRRHIHGPNPSLFAMIEATITEQVQGEDAVRFEVVADVIERLFSEEFVASLLEHLEAQELEQRTPSHDRARAKKHACLSLRDALRDRRHSAPAQN